MRLPEAFLTLDVTVRRASASANLPFLLMFIKTLMNEDYFTGPYNWVGRVARRICRCITGIIKIPCVYIYIYYNHRIYSFNCVICNCISKLLRVYFGFFYFDRFVTNFRRENLHHLNLILCIINVSSNLSSIFFANIVDLVSEILTITRINSDVKIEWNERIISSIGKIAPLFHDFRDAHYRNNRGENSFSTAYSYTWN